MLSVRSLDARTVADAVGIAASTACALHCLVVPISLVAGSLGPLPQVDDEIFHRGLLGVVLPAATIAFAIGCIQHKDRLVLALGVIGLACLTAAFALHYVTGERGERVLVMISAAMLIVAHARNFRLCRIRACDHGRSGDEKG